MEEKNVYPTAGRHEIVELDPEIWKHLPPDLLGRALSKLPFASLVAFRAVCKDWCSVLVPHAASHAQASGSNTRRPALLYFGHDHHFGHDDQTPPVSDWWLHLQAGVPIEVHNNFEPPHFPLPSPDEYIRLLASEGGLLFFAFIHKQSHIMQDIVASNPLTGKSKRLGLPCPLLFSFKEVSSHSVLVGVAFNVETDNYELVAAGPAGLGWWLTLTYSSSTCSWRSYPSIFDSIVGADLGKQTSRFGEITTRLKRGIYCNGNLYWSTSYLCYDIRPAKLYLHPCFLKFDLTAHHWSRDNLPKEVVDCQRGPYVGPDCQHNFNGVQMVPCHGEILIWHMHRYALAHRRSECPPECNDFNCPVHNCSTWTSNGRSRVGDLLQPGFKLMSHDMIAEIEEVLDFDESGRGSGKVGEAGYLGFSHGDFLYHVMTVGSHRASSEYFLRIVAQNVNDKSCTEIRVSMDRHNFLTPGHVWIFPPSLTAVP